MMIIRSWAPHFRCPAMIWVNPHLLPSKMGPNPANFYKNSLKIWYQCNLVALVAQNSNIAMGDPNIHIYIYMRICRYICVYIILYNVYAIYRDLPLFIYPLFFTIAIESTTMCFSLDPLIITGPWKSYVKSPDQHARVACSFCSQSCLRIARETATGPWRLDTNKKQPEIRLVVAVGFEMAGG